VEKSPKCERIIPKDEARLERGYEMMARFGKEIRRLLHTAQIGYHWKIRRSPIVPYLPYGVSIEVTNRCNFKCAFCPQALPDHFDKIAATTLTPERADSLIGRIRESGVATTIIHWTLDGEPFMNKQFAEIIQRAVNYGFDTHHFGSNALLMTPECLLELPGNGQAYYISPDFCSDAKLFEAHRGTPGSWEVVRANLVAALENSNLAHVRLIVHDISSYAIHDPADLERRFADLRALLPKSDRLVLRRRIFHNAAGLSISSVERAGEHEPEASSPATAGQPSDKRKYHVCPYPWYSMSIASNGDVVACCRDLEHQSVMGNLFEQGLEEIWNGEAFQSMRRDLAGERPDRQSACAGCDMPWDESKFSAGNLLATARNRLLLFRS
jgi:radical SAM protein with 4Fe4S-binding SPASM domain